MKTFLWIPGEGYDIAAVKRLQENFTCPSKPMGEPWFNTDKRVMYDYLSGDISKIKVNELMTPLEAISSGTSSFGHEDEWWSPWFHYLMGQLMRKNHEKYVDYLLEYLITAFISQYPDCVSNEPYVGFKEDAINTLGKCIMDAECWNENKIVMGKVLCSSNNNPARYWGWDKASGDFSASIFFCLKYLRPEQISEWCKSVLEIESPHWSAQLIVWLVGAHKILNGEQKHPSEFSGNPDIGWAWSHDVDGFQNYLPESQRKPTVFLPKENSSIFLSTVRSYINEQVYLDWLTSISEYDYIEAEMGGIPNQFEELYI